MLYHLSMLQIQVLPPPPAIRQHHRHPLLDWLILLMLHLRCTSLALTIVVALIVLKLSFIFQVVYSNHNNHLHKVTYQICCSRLSQYPSLIFFCKSVFYTALHCAYFSNSPCMLTGQFI